MHSDGCEMTAAVECDSSGGEGDAPSFTPSSSSSSTPAATAAVAVNESLTPSDLRFVVGSVELIRQEWRLLLSLSCVALFVNFQPSEPYLTKFLVDDKGLNSSDVETYVWPYDTYGSLIFMLPIGAACEVVGYWPVVLFGLLCRQATRVLLLYAHGLPLMSFMQLTYAAATSTTTIYYAYAFLACPPTVAPIAAALMLAATHVGNLLGSVASQVLVAHVSLRALFYMSWASASVGLLLFLAFFPGVTQPAPPSLFAVVGGAGGGLRGGWRSLCGVYTELYGPLPVQMWTVWWVAGYSGAFALIGNYYQNQLLEINPNGDFGYAAAAIEAVAASGALLSAAAPEVLRRAGAHVLIVGCVVSGVTAYLSTTVESFTASMLLNAVSYGLLSLQLAVAEISISHAIAATRRYSLVFATNAFCGRAVAVVVVKVLSSREARTTAFYYAAIVQLLLAAAFAAGLVLFRRAPRG